MDRVTVSHLQMLSPVDHVPAREAPGLLVQECELPQYAVNRFLYQWVGQAWDWQEKLSWSDQQWQHYAERPELRTWVAYHRGSPAGFYELEQQPGQTVEIKYFGLAGPFIGKGFGGHLLSHALQSAWNWAGTRRVWVHTCTLDHPGALANYQARGMRLFKTETLTQ